MDKNNNGTTDKLVKKASGEAPNDQENLVELLSAPECVYPIQPVTSDSPTWIDELITYITSIILPDDRDRARKI